MTSVDKNLFRDGHYLGRPAAPSDRIVHRRVGIVLGIEGFCDKSLDLVDVGCGNGATTVALASSMRSCTGLEIHREHQARFETLRGGAGADNCRLVHIDIEKERFDQQFDRLVSFEVIEHLGSEESVRRFTDLLKPGGLAAISVPNKWWVFETHGARLPFLPWNRVPFFSWLPRPLHERWANARIYTRPRIHRLLERSGLEVLWSKYVTAPMDVLPPGRLKELLTTHVFDTDTTRIPIKATSIFVLARRPF